MKVFLGGTCNESTWRDNLIPMLLIDFFNPVVDDWTPDCMAEEIRQREECDFCLYVITPKMTGVYSIAEAVDDSNKRPEKTIFCVLPIDEGSAFTHGQQRSLNQVGKMVSSNGGHFLDSLEEVAKFLNLAAPMQYAPKPTVAVPAVPYGVDDEAANRIALAVYDCKTGVNPEPLLYAINRILVTEAHPLSSEGQRALLQSADVTNAAADRLLEGGE